MFVWNLEEGRVTEQMVVTIPATPGNVFPGLNVQSKYGTHRQRRSWLPRHGRQTVHEMSETSKGATGKHVFLAFLLFFAGHHCISCWLSCSVGSPMDAHPLTIYEITSFSTLQVSDKTETGGYSARVRSQ